VKIGAKVWKKQKFTAVIFFFEGNKTHFSLNTNFDKVVTVGKSNNAGVWGRSPQRQTGVRERSHVEAIFRFFFNKYTFLSMVKISAENLF